jgi:hypothetical protein
VDVGVTPTAITILLELEHVAGERLRLASDLDLRMLLPYTAVVRIVKTRRLGAFVRLEYPGLGSGFWVWRPDACPLWEVARPRMSAPRVPYTDPDGEAPTAFAQAGAMQVREMILTPMEDDPVPTVEPPGYNSGSLTASAGSFFTTRHRPRTHVQLFGAHERFQRRRTYRRERAIADAKWSWK